METLKEKKIINFIRFAKFFLFIFFSILLFLSFRNLILFSDDKFQYFLIFLFYVLILLFSIYKKNIFFINFSVLIVFNFLFTPFFLNNFYDIPSRHPNTKNNIYWEKDLSSGFVSNIHTVSTDTRGNRVNKMINYEKHFDNNFRALAFGASTTEEQGLDDNLIWTNNLINFLQKDKISNKENYEMINFGISGTRTLHHYLAFKRNLDLKPDLIIFLVGVNDWNYQIIKRNENYIFPEIEIQYDYKYSFLRDFFSKVNRIIKKKIIKEENTKIVNNSKQDLNNPYKNFIKKHIDIKNNISKYTNIDIKNVSEDYKFWIKKIIKLCKSNKLNCLFADQPSLYHTDNLNTYTKKIWMNPPFQKYKIDLKSMINIKEIYNNYLAEETIKNEISFCSLSSKVKPFFSNFIDDVHFTPNGSKLVAKALFECVKQ